jgi:3-oxoacyl-[acyl-carrier protein] reductase
MLDLGLEGKVAIITGGSDGLGRAAAERLAREGARVAICGRRKERLEQAADGIRKTTGGQILAQVADVSRAADVEALVAATVAQFGGLDILVNNAGWNIGVPFPELDKLTTDIWDRIFATNVRGPFQLARAAAVHMRQRGGGRIVNIASVAGLKPTGSSIAYASSKAALIHLTRCLAVALAPTITVNCVAPGLVEGTRMAARIPPEVVARVKQDAVLQRAAEANDIALQVLAFCRADTVTGQVLNIDAGVHFH